MSSSLITNIRGEVTYSVLRHNEVISCEKTHNMVVLSSRGFLARLASGQIPCSPLAAMAIGTSSIAPSINQSQLGQEVYRMVLPTSGTNGELAANFVTLGDTVTLTLRQKLTPFFSSASGIATTALTNSVTIQEFGLICGLTVAAPGLITTGTLFNRALLGPAVLLAPTDSLLIENVITWG